MLSADIVGASLLGIDPSSIPHLKIACKREGIEPSLNSIDIKGEPLETWTKKHAWDFPYNNDNTLPLQMHFMGIKGVSFPKYDHSLCSYCSLYTGALQMAISQAFKKERPFDKVEILTGKIQQPNPNMNHTVLFGKCQSIMNMKNPDIKHPIPILGCPPKTNYIISGFEKAGILLDREIFDNIESAPSFFMARYKKRPEFSDEFFMIND